jgi:hypothetical protein
MTPQARNKALDLITNPPPGSKLAAAKSYGIDLTLLVENLELSPSERLEWLSSASDSASELEQAGQRLRSKR